MKIFSSAAAITSFITTFCFADWIDIGYITVRTGAVAISICLLLFLLAVWQMGLFVYSGQVIEEEEE